MPHSNTFSVQPFARVFSGLLVILAFAISFSLSGVSPARADQSDSGLTNEFEIDYLRFIIDHHFAALRMTELAAGTQLDPPTADISPDERIQPTPNTEPVMAKATLPQIKSLARQANRMQREEILRAQSFLRNFYGIEYQPSLSSVNQEQINRLEQSAPGDDFNINFLKIFSRHHYSATTRSSECAVAIDVTPLDVHVALEEYCLGIIQVQLKEIDTMRHLLCENYQICDYQPLEGLRRWGTGGAGKMDSTEM